MKIIKSVFNFLRQIYFFTPLNLLTEEQAFMYWPIFTIFFSCLFSFDRIIADGVSYTYAIGVLTPLLFDKLIANVISKRSNNAEYFAGLKFSYAILAIVIIVISIVAYAVGAKKNHGLLQFIVFISASLIAYLFYLCMHMSDFPNMIKKYDDKPYQIIEEEQVNELKEVVNVTETKKIIDNEGVKL